MRAERLLRRLLDQPRSLSQLEAVVGSIRMSFRSEEGENMGFLVRPRLGEAGEFSKLVPRLSVRYAWDRYHQDPTRRRDVELLEHTVRLRIDRARVERALGER